MKDKRILNGWQRLGVVLSVVWCITVSSFLIYEFFDVKNSVRSINCGDREIHYRHLNNIDAPEILCDSDAFKALPKRTQLNNLRDRKYVKDVISFSGLPKKALMFIAAPIIFLWFFSYSTYFTVRWVKNGFSKND